MVGVFRLSSKNESIIAKRGWVLMEPLLKVERLLKKHPLCDPCLGRQFALLGCSLSNKERGAALKRILTMHGHHLALSKKKAGVSILQTVATNGALNIAAEVLEKIGKKPGKPRECYLCHEEFSQLGATINVAVKKLKKYEYSSFLVGVSLPKEVEEKEDELKAAFKVSQGESMRKSLSRVLGKKISRITEKETDFKKPDIVILLNPFTRKVSIQSNPLYLQGRYRKLIRGLPQSKWICHKCTGTGCQECNWSGKLYSDSVEEVLVEPMLDETGGGDAAFHAAGREDVDVRMLGKGRPFIVEIKRPKKRFLDLPALEHRINTQKKVTVSNLCFSSKEKIKKLKIAEKSNKVYKATVLFDRAISDEKLRVVENVLTNAIIKQQTPLRVLHRRADRLREKRIYVARIKRLAPRRVDLIIRCDGGLYIKELITGDEGRTDPCVSTLVNAEVKTLELDVLKVMTREF